MESPELLKKLYEIIDYEFNNVSLIQTALTHSSYANESKENIPFNERLEFLGDSVLGLIISDYLYNYYPDLSEGDLSKIRAAVVSEVSLAQKARELQIGSFLRLGKGEESLGGRDCSSVLADALESLIGAIYLDSSLYAAKTFVLKIMIPAIEAYFEGKGEQDYKTVLQELLQSQSTSEITYQVVKETGPDHDKRFIIEVCHGRKIIGIGEGKNKKQAEQKAAQNALVNLGKSLVFQKRTRK